MISHQKLTVCAVGLFLAAFAVSVCLAEAPVPEERRIVVVGEVQGAYQALVKTLQVAELIDEEMSWIGGRASLVQTGDFLDGGTGVRQVMELLIRLQEEAENAGGQVIVLLGNHEAMNLLGELRDVNYLTYETFADAGSVARQDLAYRRYHSWLSRMAEEAGGDPPPVVGDETFRSEWFAAHPPGWVEYTEAIGPDGGYGRWLRTLPVAVRIGELLFVHGGIDPAIGIDRIGPVNERVADEIGQFDRYKERMITAGLTTEFSSVNEMVDSLQAEIEFLNAQPPASRDRKRLETAASLQDLQSYGDWYLLASNGPLWYRASETEANREAIASIFETMGVHVLISGQNATNRQLTAEGGGTVVFASTGMSDDPWVKFQPAWVEVENDGVAFRSQR